MSPYIAHLIGDFILQTDWMAVRKKRSYFACLIHVLVYLIPFLACDLEWWQFALIGVMHFAQDRSAVVWWWMRVWKRVPREDWGVIPFYVDQSFHLVQIAIVILLGNI
ncbi:MAG: DUF3307 domain-containing protein [Chloroflexota bacterium]|nr:DUF3307 domain-containing protein [Chloroflexota bacterium]